MGGVTRMLGGSRNMGLTESNGRSCDHQEPEGVKQLPLLSAFVTFVEGIVLIETDTSQMKDVRVCMGGGAPLSHKKCGLSRI
jgi:hypothetical protein